MCGNYKIAYLFSLLKVKLTAHYFLYGNEILCNSRAPYTYQQLFFLFTM